MFGWKNEGRSLLVPKTSPVCVDYSYLQRKMQRKGRKGSLQKKDLLNKHCESEKSKYNLRLGSLSWLVFPLLFFNESSRYNYFFFTFHFYFLLDKLIPLKIKMKSIIFSVNPFKYVKLTKNLFYYLLLQN